MSLGLSLRVWIELIALPGSRYKVKTLFLTGFLRVVVSSSKDLGANEIGVLGTQESSKTRGLSDPDLEQLWAVKTNSQPSQVSGRKG